jgi:hypothetical protein
MTELLNVVDGNAMESVFFPTFTSSRTRIPQIDNGPQDFAKNLLPSRFTEEIAAKN